MTIAKHLEHTLLKPEATVEDIMQLCSEARKYGLFGVCVNPCYVGLARHLLSDTNVKVVTVVGFPLGAVEAHADEIDMVMNVSAFKTGDYAAVVSDIRSVVEAASPFPVKVIIEACLLTDAEKCTACRLVAEGGAAFVKTSTGFNKGGATVDDVKLLAAEAEKYGLKVKAAGGIRDAEAAQAMLAAGAERIGTSAGHKIAAGEA